MADPAHPLADRLGDGSTADDVRILVDSQVAALDTLPAAEAELGDAVDGIATALDRGGRVLYAGAGTSGWLAALDAAEVVATYGMAGRVAAVVAGGLTLDPTLMTSSEDDSDAAAAAIEREQLGPHDVLIAVSASGRTPFTVSAASAARGVGAAVIAVVGVDDAHSPLADLADVTVHLPTHAEVVAGSTRLAAGLAQKAALNIISTAAMVRAGRAHRGQMVCVDPGNTKLRRRLVHAIAVSTRRTAAEAEEALRAARGRGDVAVVVLESGLDPHAAQARLEAAHGSIRAALS